MIKHKCDVPENLGRSENAAFRKIYGKEQTSRSRKLMKKRKYHVPENVLQNANVAIMIHKKRKNAAFMKIYYKAQMPRSLNMYCKTQTWRS
jgi:hypothetical protein